jgi:serine phosphatase RsbU (regulator of sigma subunit)
MITVMEVLVFAALFVIIYILVKKLVVKDIHRINNALSRITDGNLDTEVDVRSHEEFAALSDDINATVDTLKGYIADAAARIDQELAFAKAIQHSALPSVFPPYPNRTEFGIWAEMFTAKEVGGDFYDFYFLNENTLAFLVADVSGKGIPAAMFMMTAKTLLKSYAEAGMDVDQVLTNANNALCQNNEAAMFVTVWMGLLDTRTGLVTYANAGHNPPLLRRKDGSTQLVKSQSDLFLAVMENIQYKKHQLQLHSGDVLYLYTDGVTEATDQNEQLYGEDRLLKIAGQSADPKTLCALVKADVDAFVGQAPQFDDITMLALSYQGTQKEAAQ